MSTSRSELIEHAAYLSSRLLYESENDKTMRWSHAQLMYLAARALKDLADAAVTTQRPEP